MSQYLPNFRDPRNQRRCNEALNFVELFARSDEPKSIASTQLYKHFGNTSRPLGKWLLETLLVVADPYFNTATGTTKKYLKNQRGVNDVKQYLGLKDFEPKIEDQLTAQIQSGEFEYDSKSNRLFNPLQFIPRRHRSKILNNHGYRYHYDISSAAPRLLVQRAQRLAPNTEFKHLTHYINNRDQVRSEISQCCGISIEQAKTVVNSILQGGVISAWYQNKTFIDLNYNFDAVIRLNNNPTVIDIKRDISELWKSLRDEFPVDYYTNKNGKQIRKRLSGRQKSGYYRELEHEVGDVIRRLLRKQRVRALWLHDGWCCDKAVDPSHIVNEVRRQTGFVIELDWAIYEE